MRRRTFAMSVPLPAPEGPDTTITRATRRTPDPEATATLLREELDELGALAL